MLKGLTRREGGFCEPRIGDFKGLPCLKPLEYGIRLRVKSPHKQCKTRCFFFQETLWYDGNYNCPDCFMPVRIRTTRPFQQGPWYRYEFAFVGVLPKHWPASRKSAKGYLAKVSLKRGLLGLTMHLLSFSAILH
jgi:hypothetical protein